jgi:hypothetical protein
MDSRGEDERTRKPCINHFSLTFSVSASSGLRSQQHSEICVVQLAVKAQGMKQAAGGEGDLRHTVVKDLGDQAAHSEVEWS